jgi:hypothetical protein
MTGQEAIKVICKCLDAGQFLPTEHFDQRMEERGLFWWDIVAVIEQPNKIENDGYDTWGRNRWLVSGDTPDNLPIKIVCALEERDDGGFVVLITIHYED